MTDWATLSDQARTAWATFHSQPEGHTMTTSTTPDIKPTVPTVSVGGTGISSRSVILTIRRAAHTHHVAVNATGAQAERIASEIRGALTDAYLAGRADVATATNAEPGSAGDV